MKKCSDVMTENLAYCMPDEPVSQAALLMKKEDIGSVLVVDNDRDQRLVGIVTDRDLALKVVGDGMRLVGIISQADVATRVGEPEKTGEVVKEISQS